LGSQTHLLATEAEGVRYEQGHEAARREESAQRRAFVFSGRFGGFGFGRQSDSVLSMKWRS